MNFCKRLEVWLLLAAGPAAMLWVLLPERTGDEEPAPAGLDAAADPALRLIRCTLERDHGNARLDLELRYRNDAARPLFLAAPDVRLLTPQGAEVPAFVLPTEKPPQIPARSTQDARLRFWLDKSHLQDALELEIRGAHTPVKGTAPFDLGTLENHKPRTWPGAIE
jgi:hypothetical protein